MTRSGIAAEIDVEAGPQVPMYIYAIDSWVITVGIDWQPRNLSDSSSPTPPVRRDGTIYEPLPG